MTQISSDPEFFEQNGHSRSIFINRVFTYINTSVGQIFRNYATQMNVDYSNTKRWYHFIPVLAWFAEYFDNAAEKSVDLVTYDFTELAFSSFD